MGRKRGSNVAGKPVAGQPAGAAPVSGAGAENKPGAVDGVLAVGTAAADQAGEAADTGATAGACLAGGTDAANADTPAPAVAAGTPATEKAVSHEARYFTKRSVTISAMPTDGTPESNRAVIDWTRDSATPAFMDKNADDKAQLSINTLEGTHWVTPGDWIVRGIKGEHYPVKPDIFDATYDQVRPVADSLTFKSPLDIAELARGVAGAARFFADGAVGAPGLFDRDEAAIMADFVRGNPDAPVAAMFIHLSLQKRYPRTEPNTADLFVLSLFHSACVAAIKFEADQAAEEAAKVPPAPAAGGWPGEQALQPSQPAFAPTGFSPR
jgi:hypothetical protein